MDNARQILLPVEIPSDEEDLPAAFRAVDEAPPRWTDEAILRLHFILLDDCQRIADPETPLEEKFELLEWMFTDPEREALPFSFANCLKLYARATNPSQGSLDPREVRAHFYEYIVRWVGESLDRYPPWVREAWADNPEWVATRLARNPQWINEAVRQQSLQQLALPL
jgi:hypothetical protein